MNKTEDLVEIVAQAIYCDSYTQYGTCTPDRWKRTSESQREFTRGQARAAISVMIQAGIVDARKIS